MCSLYNGISSTGVLSCIYHVVSLFVCLVFSTASSPLEHECLRRLLHCQLQAANISNANHLAALETIETTLNECHAALEDAVSACDFVLPVVRNLAVLLAGTCKPLVLLLMSHVALHNFKQGSFKLYFTSSKLCMVQPVSGF